MRVLCLKVVEKKHPDRPACAELEARQWALMVKCWSYPQKRPTASEAVILVAGLLDPTKNVEGGAKVTVHFSVCVIFMVFNDSQWAPV